MDKNEVTAIKSLSDKIVTLADEINIHVDLMRFDSDVIDQLSPSLVNDTGSFENEGEDFGNVFGVDVGMIRNSTYKKILKLIIDDKNDYINEWNEIINTMKHNMAELVLPF